MAFVVHNAGRALIADEMGLGIMLLHPFKANDRPQMLRNSGKTRTAIAAATCYRDEWPVLIICPSSARHHVT